VDSPGPTKSSFRQDQNILVCAGYQIRHRRDQVSFPADVQPRMKRPKTDAGGQRRDMIKCLQCQCLQMLVRISVVLYKLPACFPRRLHRSFANPPCFTHQPIGTTKCSVSSEAEMTSRWQQFSNVEKKIIAASLRDNSHVVAGDCLFDSSRQCQYNSRIRIRAAVIKRQ
jgi:hypothetical protein